EAGDRRTEVVEPRRSIKLAVRTDAGRRLRVMQAHVGCSDLINSDPRRVCKERERRRGALLRTADGGEPDHGLRVPLPVEGETRVGLAVEMDRELRDAGHRARARQVLDALASDDPTGELQIAVEPGVEQRAAVDLDAHLTPAVGRE